MDRRAPVVTLLLVLVPVLAGCVDTGGSNPVLSIENQADEPVTVSVTVYPDVIGEVNETGPPFYAETVTVDPGATRALRVFTDRDQYRVRVRSDGQSVAFPTRPICSIAHTNVTVTASGRLTYHAEFCEGLPATGSSSVPDR